MIKTKRNEKWKISQALYLSSYKNHKVKVKLWWLGARERKKGAFFVPFILSEGNFFNICVLSQCIVYWIHFQNIHNFRYQKTLLYTLLFLDETHLDVMRGLIWLRGFTQCINKKSSLERCYYVRADQAEKTDLLKYFAKDWIQYWSL